MARHNHKREVGGEPRMEAAPAMHTEAEAMEAKPDLFIVADHIPDDHLLRVRVGSDAFTADELSRKFRIKQSRFRALLTTGAIVRAS